MTAKADPSLLQLTGDQSGRSGNVSTKSGQRFGVPDHEAITSGCTENRTVPALGLHPEVLAPDAEGAEVT